MFKLDLIINIFRTSFKQVPSINGKEVDLYLLYWLVTAQGGWEKVGKYFVRLIVIYVLSMTINMLKY